MPPRASRSERQFARRAERLEREGVRVWRVGAATLVEGAHGPEVAELQRYLHAEGFFRSPYGFTGYFGPATKEAVMAWQADAEVPATGNFGPLSREAYLRSREREKGRRQAAAKRDLEAMATPPPPPPPPPSEPAAPAEAQAQAQAQAQAAAPGPRAVSPWAVGAGAVLLAGAWRAAAAWRGRRGERELLQLEREAREGAEMRRRWKRSLEEDRPAAAAEAEAEAEADAEADAEVEGGDGDGGADGEDAASEPLRWVGE